MCAILEVRPLSREPPTEERRCTDYETTADLNEAIHYERLDADIEMAEFEAEGRRISALHKRGICTHGAGLGHRAAGDLQRRRHRRDAGQGPPR